MSDLADEITRAAHKIEFVFCVVYRREMNPSTMQNLSPICCDEKRKTKNGDLYKNIGKFKMINAFISYYECERCHMPTSICELCAKKGLYATIIKYAQNHNDNLIIEAKWHHLMKYHADRIMAGPDEYWVSIRGASYEAVLDCEVLLEDYCQLAFVKRINAEIDDKIVITKIETLVEIGKERAALVGGMDGVECFDDFYEWFGNFIIECNYKCTNCEEEYEDGLPSIEMIILHLSTSCEALARV